MILWKIFLMHFLHLNPNIYPYVTSVLAWKYWICVNTICCYKIWYFFLLLRVYFPHAKLWFLSQLWLYPLSFLVYSYSSFSSNVWFSNILSKCATVAYKLVPFTLGFRLLKRSSISLNVFQEDLKDVLLLAKITELLLALSLYAFLISFMGCFKEIRVLTLNVQLVEDKHRYQDEENRQVILYLQV